jgi:SAM-dependent methyltransferase
MTPETTPRPVDVVSAPCLVHQDYVPRYEMLLRQHLPSRFAGFAGFFSNMDRLETMASILGRHFSGTGRAILNAGCGTFATEIFVAAFQNQHITSFDYTVEFAPFAEIFRSEGVLRDTTFMQADAMTVTFEPQSFDLIVMHDLLYEKALHLDALMVRYRVFLAPGGLVYFDFMNKRLRWIWALLAKEKQYRRYDRREVLAILARHDMEIIEQRPVKPSGSSRKAAFHWVLRNIFRTSNAIAVVARLGPAA